MVTCYRLHDRLLLFNSAWINDSLFFTHNILLVINNIPNNPVITNVSPVNKVSNPFWNNDIGRSLKNFQDLNHQLMKRRISHLTLFTVN